MKHKACSLRPSLFWGAGLALGMLVSSAQAEVPVNASVQVRPRATLQVEFEGVSEVTQSTLQPRLEHQKKRVFAQARLEPAKQSQDLWIRAMVSKRVDEDGNLGFDLVFLGERSGKELRWPELERRCTLCTHGEFVEVFGRALSALVKYGMLDRATQRERPEPKLVSPVTKSAKQYKLASAERTPAISGKAPPLEARSFAPVPVDPSPSDRSPLRWWGWTGVGFCVAGSATVIASLAAMPRNVPLPDDPTQMYPAHFDRGTRVGVILGGSSLLIGMSLWVVDKLSRKPRAKSSRRSLTSASPLVWEF